ncbi:MAG: T9SS type A sorting domain-containing protein [Candidatus Electryonea clarkiae]|nr:T9SS type A sorting domain-containing protein [Candidatus Electryonea clarkiae]MDP8289281.1 T9SS type A sorting domain-containing protein [Candidatus Electryonea clarkiae]
MRIRNLFFTIVCITLSINEDNLAQDSLNVTLVGYCNIPSSARDVAVSGDFAYVIAYSHGLRIINISDPANPEEVGFYDTTDYPVQLELSDRYVYLADNLGSLRIIDINNANNPQEIGYFDGNGQMHNAEDLGINGSYVYLIVSSNYQNYELGLHVIDINDPSTPFEVGHYRPDGRGVDSIVLTEDYAYVGSGGVAVVDITDPANPFETGFTNEAPSAIRLAYSEGLVFVADGGGGMKIIDVSDPTDPYQIGHYLYEGDSNCYDVTISGDYAFLAYGSAGVRVIDISDPLEPAEVGYHTNDSSAAIGIFVNDDYLFVTGPGLTIYDCSEAIQQNPDISIREINHNFGAISLGDSAQWELVIDNVGVGDLILDSVLCDNEAFRFEEIVNLTISSDSSDSILITFVPEEEIHYEGTLTIYSNDPNEQERIVRLEGWGGEYDVGEGNDLLIPTSFGIESVYPNPFNSSVEIHFALPEPATINLTVYNITGQAVETLINNKQNPGEYSVIWKAQDFPSGIYFIRLSNGISTDIKKTILLK